MCVVRFAAHVVVRFVERFVARLVFRVIRAHCTAMIGIQRCHGSSFLNIGSPGISSTEIIGMRAHMSGWVYKTCPGTGRCRRRFAIATGAIIACRRWQRAAAACQSSRVLSGGWRGGFYLNRGSRRGNSCNLGAADVGRTCVQPTAGLRFVQMGDIGQT